MDIQLKFGYILAGLNAVTYLDIKDRFIRKKWKCSFKTAVLYLKKGLFIHDLLEDVKSE